MILVFGILSLVFCPLLGPFAWIMGRQDLQAIREGRMDPSAEPLTRAGMICGIIGSIWLALGLLWIGFWILLMILAAVFG